LVSQERLVTSRHQTAYWQAVPEGSSSYRGTIFLIHGWPERAISWRHQWPYLCALGYRVIAPDMRGYGDSSTYSEHKAFAVEQAVTDMIELQQHLGETRSLWVGHDWGSPVVWSLASHHPERCMAVANLCVPYLPGGFTLPQLVPLVDRVRYPLAEYPVGQWDYFLDHREHFERAVQVFEADIPATFKILFRRGKPFGNQQVARLSLTRSEGGWFGGAKQAPNIDIDSNVLDNECLQVYVDGILKNGFFGPNSWYLNDEANTAYAARAQHSRSINMPVLFLHARYDHTCETLQSNLCQPMRAACPHLVEAIIDSGHWMSQEKPSEVNQALAKWLASLNS
jgi:pimeloyl-ACP methyl ester carboxylesterase